VFIDGTPDIEGETILEKRRYFRENFDYIRTGTMLEPRDHADMYGAILTKPITGDGDNVISTTFTNVPSFMLMENQKFEVPGIGIVHFDIGYGGAFYATYRSILWDLI